MPMLSRPRKPPAKTLRPSGSLRFTHQLKLQHQAVERALEEPAVRGPARLLALVEKQGRPGVNRWVDIAEVPLVGGNLSVRVRVQAAKHQQQLTLGKVEVDQRKRGGVERKIP